MFKRICSKMMSNYTYNAVFCIFLKRKFCSDPVVAIFV